MKRFTGVIASPGIIIGNAFVYIEEEYSIPKYDILETQIKSEHERFLKAVNKAVGEIKNIKNKKTKKINKEELRLLDSHILMLEDPEIKSKILQNLHEKKKNVEWILLQVIEESIEKLNALKDEYLKERRTDFFDISQRILRNLLYKKRHSLSKLKEEVVVVAKSLLPSDVLAMNKDLVKGIVTESGATTSHLAILARSFEIPAIVALSGITEYVVQGDTIIVDGEGGKVILKPDKKTRDNYIKSQKKWRKHEARLLNLNKLPAITRDGKVISLKANIEIPEEVKSVILHGADGIGLYRSEFLFIRPSEFPSEEEQYEAYSYVLKAFKKNVCIRTLDYGGEKVTPGFNRSFEQNPILGWRAIRFCISHPKIFKTQLRALLRASRHGNLRIMFPMVSGIEELSKLFSLVDEVKKELEGKNIRYDKNIKIGIMIEVPSAALTSDLLAKSADFFSIGTNDLIQYTIAVDRGNKRVAYLYEPFHPAVLRLIKLVIDNAKKNKIEVEMCGEMAGNFYALPLLLGLGLENFSMSSFRIPEIKRLIRSIELDGATKLASKAIEMSQAKKIEKLVKKWVEERLDSNSKKN